MNTTRHYRERAIHYRRAARETDDPKLRKQFEFVATDYEQLAEGSGRHLVEKGTPDRSKNGSGGSNRG